MYFELVFPAFKDPILIVRGFWTTGSSLFYVYFKDNRILIVCSTLDLTFSDTSLGKQDF